MQQRGVDANKGAQNYDKSASHQNKILSLYSVWNLFLKTDWFCSRRDSCKLEKDLPNEKEEDKKVRVNMSGANVILL